MSHLARLFSARRAYSSFFSSKPGGGRYFNSSKPPKPVGVTPKGTSLSSEGTNAETQVKQDSQSPEATQTDEHTTKNHAHPVSHDSQPTMLASLSSLTTSAAAHPDLSRNDLRLHQFFSLHRPLLFLSNPDSILASGPAQFNTSYHSETSNLFGEPSHGFCAEASEIYDVDAEAARQLNRALSMTRAAPTVAWEDTLRHLGLDVNQDPSRLEVHRQLSQQLEQVQMDSVKRKRRKKMKKHKLKKRRRATRFQRLRAKQG